MFSKPDKTSPAPRAAGAEHHAPRKAIAASLIGENVSLQGDLASDGDVHLDGVLRGDMRVRELTIGESGVVEGSIEAETVEIRGKVVGSVTAKTVRLFSTARVEGDITHGQLAIEAGAHFEGRSLKFETPATVEPLAISAE
jgi:cytoskeletal protein CcmA (bactofilin family)